MAKEVAGSYYVFKDAYTTLADIILNGIISNLSVGDSRRFKTFVVQRSRYDKKDKLVGW